MNRLTGEVRSKVVELWMEGVSLRGTSRLVGISINTVKKLRSDLSMACELMHDRLVNHLYPRQIQCDEAWAIIRGREEWRTKQWTKRDGASWVWSAIDRESRLFVSWKVGKRDHETAVAFLTDVHARCHGSYDLVTDGCFSYPRVHVKIFPASVRHIVLNPDRPRDAHSTGRKHASSGDITTNHVERHNLAMRTRIASMRRNSNAFAKTHGGLSEMVSIYAAFYNFCLVHKATGYTPAVKAGLIDRQWTISDLIRELEITERPRIRSVA